MKTKLTITLTLLLVLAVGFTFAQGRQGELRAARQAQQCPGPDSFIFVTGLDYQYVITTTAKDYIFYSDTDPEIALEAIKALRQDSGSNTIEFTTDTEDNSRVGVYTVFVGEIVSVVVYY